MTTELFNWTSTTITGDDAVPLAEVCETHFGMTYREACRAATLNKLPVPTFKLRDSRKSPWMLSRSHLAALVRLRHEEAAREWERSQA